MEAAENASEVCTIAKPVFPWEDVVVEDFSNKVAYDTCNCVHLCKTGWGLPASYLSRVYQQENQINPSQLASSCKYVRDRRLKLQRSNEEGLESPACVTYLREPFSFISSLTSPTPKKKKRRVSAKALTVNQLSTSLGCSEPDSSQAKQTDEAGAYMYQSLLEDNRRLSVENEELKSQLMSEVEASATRQVLTSPKRTSQEWNRQRARAESWKIKFLNLKKNYNCVVKYEKEVKQLRVSVRKFNSLLTSQRHYYKAKISAMETDEKVSEEKICRLKAQVLELENELEIAKETPEDRDTDGVLSTKDGNVYDTRMRRCVYQALEHQCPVDHAAKLVKYVAEEFTGANLSSTPCAATVSRMAREMGTLADYQSGHSLANAENCTVAWDATELPSGHINEVHLAVPNTDSTRDYITLSVAQLPGGTTSDYSEHIQRSIKDVADTYCQYSGGKSEEILDRMHSHITASIADRAAVNHCVAEQLKNTVNPALVELKCNVHPLDSLASKGRSALKATGLRGATYGQDCAAANLLHGLSKLRYKHGKGDPIVVKNFKSRGIPLKLFPRYVGNRIHIMFHLSGIYYHLQETVVDLLANYCSPRGGLTAALLSDITNPNILQHLQVLGLFGKIVTGPWMNLLYSEEKKNLDMADSLKTCVQAIESYSNNPGDILFAEKDAFSKTLGEDPVLASLRATETVDTNAVKVVAKAFLDVCNRQLVQYLANEFTPEQRELSKSTPTHNMQSERVMGMCDAQTRRAPNAKVDFVEAKIKAKTNKSLSWLDNQSPEERNTLVRYVVTRSGKLSSKRKAEQNEVEAEIMRRLKQKQRSKDEGQRKKLEKRVEELAAKGSVSSEQLQQLLDCTVPIKETLLTLMNTPAAAVGTVFLHTWFDETSDANTIYRGTITKLKRRKVKTFVVAYHDQGESEAETVDYDITRKQLVADALCGELTIL